MTNFSSEALTAVAGACWRAANPATAKKLDDAYRDLCRQQKSARRLLEYLDSTSFETRAADRAAGRGPSSERQRRIAAARQEVREQITEVLSGASPLYGATPAEFCANVRAYDEAGIRDALRWWRS